MRITDPEIIKSGESELIDSITADMDWGEIGKVFVEKHHLYIADDVEYKDGDIIVHKDQIAYQLNFDVKVSLSIVLNREGNYLSLLTSLDEDADRSKAGEASVAADRAANEGEASVAADRAANEGEESLSPSEQDESGNDEEPPQEVAPETAAPGEEPTNQASQT